MGTSSSGSGAGSSHSLIPSFIDPGFGGGTLPSPIPGIPPLPNLDPAIFPTLPVPNNLDDKRYKQAKEYFGKYLESKGKDNGTFTRSVKSYIKKGSGGSAILSRRMLPAASRVARFYETLEEIKTKGPKKVLEEFDLSYYTDQPLLEILAALSDEIFRDTGRLFEETQDDSLARRAFSNTIVRISELVNIDLNKLTNDQVEVMVSIFIEETIVQRVIYDVGPKLTEKNKDVAAMVQVEENIYQMVTGWVRNIILPQLKPTRNARKDRLIGAIENIYRMAFDAIVDAAN